MSQIMTSIKTQEKELIRLLRETKNMLKTYQREQVVLQSRKEEKILPSCNQSILRLRKKINLLRSRLQTVSYEKRRLKTLTEKDLSFYYIENYLEHV